MKKPLSRMTILWFSLRRSMMNKWRHRKWALSSIYSLVYSYAWGYRKMSPEDTAWNRYILKKNIKSYIASGFPYVYLLYQIAVVRPFLCKYHGHVHEGWENDKFAGGAQRRTCIRCDLMEADYGRNGRIFSRKTIGGSWVNIKPCKHKWSLYKPFQRR